MVSPRIKRITPEPVENPLPRRTFISKLATAGACLPALAKVGCAGQPGLRARLACQTNAWPFESGIDGLVPVLETIKSLGFHGYETSFRNIQEAFSNPGPAKDRLDKTGLACAGVHIAAPSQYEAETGIPPLEFLKETAAGSGALGAEYLILSGRGVGVANGLLDPDALNRKIAALLEVAQYCQDAGLTLSYHNHVDDFILGGAEIDALLVASQRDRVTVWYCVNNAQKAKAPIAEYFSNHHDSIAGIHLTNISIESPGEHRQDDKPLLSEIQKTNWDGWLVVEEERTLERREWPETPAIEKSREYIRQTFGI